eukprot:CAMPEP_0185026164 /NCGR_PEP_ID=MMETSP1103-20130426/10127_1 /TAXON_ID=36769 /ORGANISM="Paraphysomonas bandaiensis, Strain Caron Lab Isolate" /LENGTH=674 /DNA_ID=CAMNT_0027559655 /DNA_START=162 /DNA_END=2186 /DNA_ORIENTATION=+
MSEKLLMKPPFRFLHDTITAIINTTGFAEGLYSPEEMDSSNISDKNSKIAYLEKIFAVVGICQGAPLDVKGSKVVAGLEPENTSTFLALLGEFAASETCDSAAAVRRYLDGEQPGSAAPPVRDGPSQAKSSDRHDAPSKGHKMDMPDEKDGGMDSKHSADAIIDPPIAHERGKSRGGTRAGSRTHATSSTALGGVSDRPANMDAEIDRCDGSPEITKELLQPLITKPKLSDKLLGKPPFRFLHDIFTEVIRATGFAENLYEPAELDSANVKEKEQKIIFLEKMINLVGAQLNTLVGAKPQKIVAGLEAQDTNRFLQLLALAARMMPDSSSAVRAVHEQMGLAPAGGSAPVRGGDDFKGSQEPSPRVEERPRPKPQAQPMNAPVAAETKDDAMANLGNRGFDDNRKDTMDDKPMEDASDAMEKLGEGAESGEAKRSMRPTTARRRPPKIRDATREVSAKDTAPSTKKAEGIMRDGQNDDDDDDDIVEEERLADDKDGGDADRNQQQSKLVQDILSRQAEQEAAAKEMKGEEEKAGDKPDKAGGIRLGRLRKTGMGDKKGSAATSSGAGDIERLRKAVQILVQHTGPLGTCMDYIQEDVGIMTMELHRWEEECRKYEIEVENQKRQTQEALVPLQRELSDLEEQIQEQKMKVSVTKASIAKNENRIQQILRLTATA